MSVHHRASIYDRLRPHLDAADLIARLGLNPTRTLGAEAYCAPLCHESTSGESLQINLHTGRWNCKACQSSGIYGDLIQLVEYVLTSGSAPSKGSDQSGSESHRAAMVWLCDQFGIAFDESRVTGDDGLDVVHTFSMAAHEYLLSNDQVLEWILEKWGFDISTVEQYGIGYMPSPLLPAIAAEAARPSSRGAFRSSGMGWFAPDGNWQTRFAGRVLFPYLEHGRAVYLIGRSTPWTPSFDNGATPPKYHKLSVHSKEKPYISERVTNDHLYNEPVMQSSDAVVIAEGVADAVALSALGVPVVSPVTISFNATDLERFTRKAREGGITRAEILFDNELSGSGNWAARRAGLKLVERGLVAKILTLPLGDEQQRARDEVVQALGQELFDELERSDPRERKEIILRSIADPAKREWVQKHVLLSKIDAAEWTASVGAGAPGRFDEIRRNGRDVLVLEAEDVAKNLNMDDDPVVRLSAFSEVIHLAAHIENRLQRDTYAAVIAKLAGKGAPKSEASRLIAAARRDVVTPKRKEEKKQDTKGERESISLQILPPETLHVQPPAPAPTKPGDPNAPAAPPAPGSLVKNDHDRYAPARDAVAKGIEGKVPEEALGEYIAQTIMRSMGYTPFRTAEVLYLVRGSQRIEVASGRNRPFASLLYLAAGLSEAKAAHRSYIAAVSYFLERGARKAADVSWSFVDPVSRAVYFPLGDSIGRMLKIEPGSVSRTKMAEVRVPAVAGEEFEPIEYTDGDGGIARALDVFRWTSIGKQDRLVLLHWIACLPIMRRIGTVPIVRIEGGSASGKTRTVDAVSFLVNGRRSSSVPTAPALVSRLSREMLTIDDNRETGDMSPAFLGTLLQATHLGAREKRKANTDTGTVIERVCGALIMNGIEPIHDGRAELASRILPLRCSRDNRASDSPSAEDALINAVIGCRDAFWSESARRCAKALELDQTHGVALGDQIEAIFGATKIGRLSAYLRMMYLVWTAGLPDPTLALITVADEWAQAFKNMATGALESLVSEELTVTVLRYVFAYAETVAEAEYTGGDTFRAFDGKYVTDRSQGDAYLSPVRASQLARLARMAGKEMNAPQSITRSLRAGQLEERLLDGAEFLAAAGFAMDVETTNAGKRRFAFARAGKPKRNADPLAPEGDTWTAP